MSSEAVWYEIGRAGLSKEEGRKLLSECVDDANKQHSMGAEGRRTLPTGAVVVYNGGIDGWDARYYVENE
jgi:hypothetical protein